MAYSYYPKKTYYKKKTTDTTVAAKNYRKAKSKTSTYRSKPPAVTSNKRAIVNLQRRFNKLKHFSYGPYQQNVVKVENVQVSKNHPVCFHLNNTFWGGAGPHLWRKNGIGVIAPFNEFTRGTLYMDDNDADNWMNSPNPMVRSVKLDFEFYGHVANTHILIQIVRQKRIDTDYFRISNDRSEDMFMPQSLSKMNDMAGFASNRLDPKSFEIVTQKKVYINSKGTSNAIDLAQDRLTAYPTTGSRKLCSLYVPINKVFKQLVPTHNQYTGTNDSINVSTSHSHDTHGSFSFENQHPLAAYWCIISTDDTAGITDILTNDTVRFNLMRKNTWQDQIV